MKATDLIRDPKAWLYFFAAFFPVLAAGGNSITQNVIYSALGAGCLAVKAYTSTNSTGDSKTVSITETTSPAEPEKPQPPIAP